MAECLEREFAVVGSQAAGPDTTERERRNSQVE